MNVIALFEQHKLEYEAQLKFAETQAGFKLMQFTPNDGQVDVTEQHKQRLRRSIDVYQLTIEFLKRKISD